MGWHRWAGDEGTVIGFWSALERRRLAWTFLSTCASRQIASRLPLFAFRAKTTRAFVGRSGSRNEKRFNHEAWSSG
jgi:hypothetical protein